MIDAIAEIIAGDAPVFFLIAGPNGAGKSTYRKMRLDPVGLPCIDPDEVARNTLGHHPTTREEALAATTAATARLKACLKSGHSIGLETVFSDTEGHKLRLLEEAKRYGYLTCLIFIALESSQLCLARVMDRAAHGGHDVPDDLIEGRYPKCFENLRKAVPKADVIVLVDNSDIERHREFAYIAGGKIQYMTPDPPMWYSRIASFIA